MKKYLFLLLFLIPVLSFAINGINNGNSGVYSISGGGPSTPISLANGGLGIDYSSPAPLLRQSKDMGHAGANGGFSATAFARITVGAGQTAQALVQWLWVANDGTHIDSRGGMFIPTCEQELSGGVMAGGFNAGATNNGGTLGGLASTGASLAIGAVTASATTGTGTCDIKLAGTITTGTATSNTLYYSIWPIGFGTYIAQ